MGSGGGAKKKGKKGGKRGRTGAPKARPKGAVKSTRSKSPRITPRRKRK